jgi:hypothetical protein
LQRLRIERRLPREQFVEQHAQRIDVAARIDIERVKLRLLRTHVGRRSDELRERREHRRVRQPPLRRLRDPEIDHLRHRHIVVLRHQNIRRFDVAVDHALLVRVLNRVAHLDK